MRHCRQPTSFAYPLSYKAETCIFYHEELILAEEKLKKMLNKFIYLYLTEDFTGLNNFRIRQFVEYIFAVSSGDNNSYIS